MSTGDVWHEILAQFQRIRRDYRVPSRVEVSPDMTRSLFRAEQFMAHVPFEKTPGDDGRLGHILGLPVYPVEGSHVVRVLPEDFGGYSQGKAR